VRVKVIAKGMPLMINKDKYAKYGDIVDVEENGRIKSLIAKGLLKVVNTATATSTSTSTAQKKIKKQARRQ